jgi:hypothetical protein
MHTTFKGRVLCLFALCGLPAEAQLTQLVGGRDRPAFESGVFSFFFELFDFTMDPEHEDDVVFKALDYLNQVQLNLIAELNLKGAGLPIPKSTADLLDDILEAHRIIRDSFRLDPFSEKHTKALEDVCLDYSRPLLPDFKVSDGAIDLAKATLSEMEPTYSQYRYFKDVFNTAEFRPGVEGQAIVSELMAAFAHLARAYVFAQYKDEAQFEKDFQAGFLHARRAILDVRKGIMNTIYAYEKQNAAGFIQYDFTKEILSLRHKEVILGSHNPEKCKLYGDQAQKSMDLWIAYLREQKHIEVPAFA